MAEHERNRRWVPMDSVAPPIIATAPTAPPLNSESDEDDDDYVDAGSSFQQQQHGQDNICHLFFICFTVVLFSLRAAKTNKLDMIQESFSN